MAQSLNSTSMLAKLIFILLIQMSGVCLAYNADNVLVDYGDVLKLQKSTEPDVTVLTMDLYSFPYIDNVSAIHVFQLVVFFFGLTDLIYVTLTLTRTC